MHKHSLCRLHHNVSGKAAYLELEKQLGTLLTKPSLTGWCWTNSQFKQKQENHNPRIDFIAWHIMSGILNKWEVISLCLQLCTVNVALKELSEIEITRTRGYSGVTHTHELTDIIVTITLVEKKKNERCEVTVQYCYGKFSQGLQTSKMSYEGSLHNHLSNGQTTKWLPPTRKTSLLVLCRQPSLYD